MAEYRMIRLQPPKKSLHGWLGLNQAARNYAAEEKKLGNYE